MIIPNGVLFCHNLHSAHQLLFGDVNKDTIELNNIGQMIDWEWNQIPNRHSRVKLNKYIIMPNHFHGILQIINNLNEPVYQPYVGTPLVGVLCEILNPNDRLFKTERHKARPYDGYDIRILGLHYAILSD